MRISLKDILLFLALLLLAVFIFSYNAAAQSLGNTGTITGTVTDPTGAVVPGATVTIQNPVTGYKQEVKSGDDGSFRLTNLPPNPYHLTITS
jgi:type 1 fimbria pilin